MNDARQVEIIKQEAERDRILKQIEEEKKKIIPGGKAITLVVIAVVTAATLWSYLAFGFFTALIVFGVGLLFASMLRPSNMAEKEIKRLEQRYSEVDDLIWRLRKR